MVEPDDATVTWRDLWTAAAAELGRPKGRWLCEVASGLDGAELLAALERPVPRRQLTHFDAMLTSARSGEPLQYVLGRWQFRHLDLMVDRRVLIPRPETEEVVEVALRLVRAMPRPWICADLGTGSGAIGLSLASELPVDGVSVWLTDLSADALDVARANLAGLGRAGGHVRVAEGSWFDALPAELHGELAMVVANPPYIADRDPVEPIVAEWEPATALYGGADGLDAIRELVTAAPAWLRPGGWLVVEIGETQGDTVAGLLAAAGLGAVEIRRDASQRERIAVARRDPPT